MSSQISQVILPIVLLNDVIFLQRWLMREAGRVMGPMSLWQGSWSFLAGNPMLLWCFRASWQTHKHYKKQPFRRESITILVNDFSGSSFFTGIQLGMFPSGWKSWWIARTWNLRCNVELESNTWDFSRSEMGQHMPDGCVSKVASFDSWKLFWSGTRPAGRRIFRANGDASQLVQ